MNFLRFKVLYSETKAPKILAGKNIACWSRVVRCIARVIFISYVTGFKFETRFPIFKIFIYLLMR